MTNQCRRRLLLLLALPLLASALPAAAAPVSHLFPYCWQGYKNTAVYYVENLMTRQLVLYANPSDTEAVTHCELLIDFPPEAVQVVKVVVCDGYDRVQTEMRVAQLPREGVTFNRYIIPLWDIKPGFRWRGQKPWSKWPGWWTTIYVKGKKPGHYGVYWRLRSDQGEESEHMAPLVILPRPEPPARTAQKPGHGVGVWTTLALYGDWPEVTGGLVDTLAACGVRRLYLHARGAGSSIKAAQAAGMEVDLTNSWPYSVFAPTEPPDDCRAQNEKGEPIPGNAWCPTCVAQRNPQWEAAVRPAVADAIKTTGADGFMLDYEGAAAPGYHAADICFCPRCHQAFTKVLDGDGAGLKWPADVRPGGRWHERWLKWRQEQGALYVKHVADLAREANPQARTYTWSGGYYKPYPTHIQYTRACSDITKFAPYLTAPTVGTYIYPNRPDQEFLPNQGFGEDPKNYGQNLPDMINVIRWTIEAVAPRPVVPCVSGGHTPGGSATPLASVDLLRYQIANHLLDGAPGVDFWGTGPLDDGRYLVLMNELSGLFGEAEAYLGGKSLPLAEVKTGAWRWRAGVLQSAAGRLIVLINGDDAPRTFQVPVGGDTQTVTLPPWGVKLIPEKAADNWPD